MPMTIARKFQTMQQCKQYNMSYLLTRRDPRVRPEPEHPEDVGARRHQAGLRGRHQVARQGALHRGGGQGSAQQGEHGGGGGLSGVEDRCQVSEGDVDEVQVGRDEREQPRERPDPDPAVLLFFSRPPPVPFCFGPNFRRSNILILTRRRRRLKQGLLGLSLLLLSECKTFKK